MLEKTDELAKHRLKVAEMMLTQISEEMRQQKRIKEQTFKRVSGGGRGGGEREGRRDSLVPRPHPLTRRNGLVN